MYKVYLDGELMYCPSVKGLDLVEAKVNTELNATGTFDFSILETNKFYTKMRKMKSIVKVYDDQIRIFRGRVYQQTRTFYGQKSIICEGELAFLMDSLQRPYMFKGTPAELFKQLIENHNKVVSEERRFNVGRCTVTDPNDYIARSSSIYPKTWDEIQEKLIKPLGGYLWTREESDGVYIDYLADFDTLNPQTVEFAKNLLDFDEVVKGKDIATVIIPLGCRLKDDEGNETEERLTIASVNGGIDYVCAGEDVIEKFGRIEKPVFFNDVTLPENLIRKGRDELQNYINLLQSIELTAVDLHAINRDIKSFQVGSYTRVVSRPHDIDDLYLTRRRTINLFDPADGKLVLGAENQTFVDQFEQQKQQYDQVAETTYHIKSDYELNKEKVQTTIDSLQKSLKLELTSNFGTYQKTDSEGVVSPDYTAAPLTIAPTVYFKGNVVTSVLDFTWKKKTTGSMETPLGAGESVDGSGKLTVSHNLSEDTQYICYVTFTDLIDLKENPIYLTDSDGAHLTDEDGSLLKTVREEQYVADAYLQFIPIADGIPGDPGIPGPPGDTSYFHVKYSEKETPETAEDMTETPAAYIGTYVDFIFKDSDDPAMYKWARFAGLPGEKGVPGKNGLNGKTSYLHIAYATNSTGTSGFSVSDSAGKTYIGQYVDYEESDSTDPKKYSWTLIKGESAKLVDIVATSQIFKSTDGGNTFAPDVIKLTPAFQGGVSFQKWQYSTNGGTTWVDVVSGTNGISVANGVLTVSKDSALFSKSVTAVTFKCLSSNIGYEATKTIVKLYDVVDIEIGAQNLLRNSNTLVYEKYYFYNYFADSDGGHLIDNDGKKIMVLL